MYEADKHLKRWFGAFPELYLCRGNHDMLIERQGKTNGLPNRVLKPFRDIWNFPSTWYDAFSWEIFGVRYTHGTGLGGTNAHIKAAESSRQSCVIGHTHSTLGGVYLVSERDRIFAVNCGCGIDRHAYAFEYGRYFPKKPALGCAVVTDKGNYWQTFAMEL
jgi:predicted phosphodiesterase